MKINPILVLIGVLVAALFAYGFHEICADSDPHINLLVITGFLTTAITLAATCGLNIDHPGRTTNLRVVSALFFVLFLIEHIVFALCGVHQSMLIIVTGIALLIYLLIFYNINKTKM